MALGKKARHSSKKPAARPMRAPLASLSIPADFGSFDLSGLLGEFGQAADDDTRAEVLQDLIHAALIYWTERDRELRGAPAAVESREHLRKSHTVLRRAIPIVEELRRLWNEMPAESERLLRLRIRKDTLEHFSANDFRDSVSGGDGRDPRSCGNVLDDFCRLAEQIEVGLTQVLSVGRGDDADVTKHELLMRLAHSYFKLTGKRPGISYSHYRKNGEARENGLFLRFVRTFEAAMLNAFEREIEVRTSRGLGYVPEKEQYGLGRLERSVRKIAEEYRALSTT